MSRLLIALGILWIAAGSCSKNKESKATELTGTWIKGSNAGDTLYFIEQNGKNILRYNASFNAGLPAFTEIEYRYVNRKLALKNFLAQPGSYYPIESFRWLQQGREFEVLGYQLFPIMSSTITVFTYRKIN